MLRTVEMDFEFGPIIPGPPASPKQLFAKACSNDEVTVEAWRDIWIKQTKENQKEFGPFKHKGLGNYYDHFKLKPVIVAGSGPSLKTVVDELKNRKGIPLVSCLHNYQFMEDNEIYPEFYVSLDSGEVTISEVGEGGKKSLDEYFESTKDKKLLAFIGSHPDLIRKWKGEIIWFNAPIPDQGVSDAMMEQEKFHTYVSTGGNVLGAAFYISKAIMGANPVVFVGADFSFSYNNKFHGWDSKYDANLGEVVYATDVFGNRVKTWTSYYNFKCWFESRVCVVPGIYINASGGGIFGSYPDGNIRQVTQMYLKDVIRMYSLNSEVESQCKSPEIEERKVLF